MSVKWESLEMFSVESATGNNNLYANGRQSIKIRVGIKALDRNNQPVALTEKERLSVMLVNFHGGAELPYRNPSIHNTPLDSTTGQWDWSIQNIGGYHHFPSSGPRALSESDELPRTLDDKTAYIDLYVRTVDTNPLTVSVRITREDGEPFLSREKGGGSLVLAPVRTPTYRPSDYSLEPTVIVPRRTSGHGVLFQCYYGFGLKADTSLQFRSITCSPRGLHGDIGPGWELECADMVGYVSPGGKIIQYLFPLQYVDPELQWAARPGQIVFAQTSVASRDGYYFGQLKGRTAVLRTAISATDEYGNVHQVNLRFKDNKRFGDLELV